MKKVILLAALLMAAALPLSAATETYYHSGSCANGSVWWTVTTVIEGTVVDVTGVDCWGHKYSLGCRFASSDPIGVAGQLIVGTCGTGTYTAQVIYDEAHVPVGITGTDCAGAPYRMETFSSPANAIVPRPCRRGELNAKPLPTAPPRRLN